ncbi:MAG: ribosome maturation factor RimP [Elusimicrobiota bacterium]
MNTIIENLEKELKPFIEADGVFELVDLEYRNEGGGMVLRVFVEKKENKGISLDECAQLSRQAEELLDRENIIPGGYFLEVSSPGIYRKLKEGKDFQKFLGQKARIKLFEPADTEGQKNFLGFIRKFEDSKLTFETVEKKELVLELTKIANANLEPDLKI